MLQRKDNRVKRWRGGEVFKKGHLKGCSSDRKKHEKNEKVKSKSRKRLYQAVGKEA